MGKPPIGRIKPVELRAAWDNEAGHFTPWLAENISLLGEALGLELEIEAQERDVGPFRADILCRNTKDDTFVVVENQLEPTDHKHLGQLLTYAAGLEAVTIVWIAKEFTEEHRATLDWLNGITSDAFNFFGVEIELFQIGESPVAPHFKVISRPNVPSKVKRSQVEQAKREVFPLIPAYDYLLRKGLGNEAAEIRNSKDKYKSYNSSLRRGKVINLLERKSLLDDFVSEAWPTGATENGQKEIRRCKKIYEAFAASAKVGQYAKKEEIETTV